MPRPTSATTVARPDLAATAMEYIENQDEFIGMEIMPTFDVDEQSGEYPVIPLEAMLNAPDTKRRPRGAYPRDDWEFEMDNFDCVENGWEEPVDEVESRMYARFFDAEEIATERAIKTILRVQEKRIADMLFNTGNFTPNSLTNEWDDAANATPLNDVQAGRTAIHDAIGIEPDTLIIAYSTWQDLSLCAQLIDRIKNISTAVIDGRIKLAALASLLEVDRILVGKNMYNSAKKGQSASLSAMWSNEYAMLCVTNANRDLKKPCIGRTFRWIKDCPENALVESYEEPQTRSQIIRARQHTDEEILMASAAYLIDNVTT